MLDLLTILVTLTIGWQPGTGFGPMEYRLYWGPASGNYTNYISAGTNLTTVVRNMLPGRTYYFAATATNAKGTESDYSGEVNYTVPTNIVEKLEGRILWLPPGGNWVTFTNFVPQPGTYYRTRGAFIFVQGASRMHLLQSKDLKTWTTNFSHRVSWYDQDKLVMLQITK